MECYQRVRQHFGRATAVTLMWSQSVYVCDVYTSIVICALTVKCRPWKGDPVTTTHVRQTVVILPTAECRRQDRPSGLSSSDPRSGTSPYCHLLCRLVCAIENRHALRIQSSVRSSVIHSVHVDPSTAAFV